MKCNLNFMKLFSMKKKYDLFKISIEALTNIKSSSLPLTLFNPLKHTYPETSHYLAPTFLYLTLPIHTHLDRYFTVPHLHLTASNLHLSDLTLPYFNLFST